MSGISILVDTNVLINLAEGKSHVDRYLQGNLLYISVISEIELLGHHAIIAATSLYLSAPLLTFDKDFSKIKNLDLIIPG